MGVPQVRPAKRLVEEAMLVVPRVEGWVEGGVLILGKIQSVEEEEEGGGGGGGGGRGGEGGGGGGGGGDGGRRQWGSVEREDEEEEGWD